MPERDVARLGRYVHTRRLDLDLTQDDVTARGGPSDTTLGKIENGRTHKVSGITLRNLDVALGWVPGSSRAVLEGREPEAETPEVVSPSVRGKVPLDDLVTLAIDHDPRLSPRDKRVLKAHFYALLEEHQSENERGA